MPRDIDSGQYSLPPNTAAVTETTIRSSPYNTLIADIQTTFNTPVPIAYGGTGKTSINAFINDNGIAIVDVLTGNLATITALRAVSDTYPYSRVSVRAYYDKADYSDGIAKGGGVYSLDPDDITSADDGVTVIVDSDSRRWKLEHTGVVTLGQCGGYIDGSTDDLAAVNRAFGLLNSNTSGVFALYCEPGAAMLSDTPNPLIRANRSIFGDGRGTCRWTMKESAGTNATFIEIGDGSGNTGTRITISGIGFINANNASLTGGEAAIWLRNAVACTIDNCYFSGCNTMLLFGGMTDSGQARRCVISRCYAQPTMYNGAHLLIFNAATDCMLYGNFAAGTGTGLGNCRLISIAPVSSGQGVDDITFTANVFNFNATDIGYCIYMDATNPGIANITFTGNGALDAGAAWNIYMTIGASAPANNARINNVRIVGNRLTASTEHTSEGGGGIYVDQDIANFFNGIVIDGNVITIGKKEALRCEAVNSSGLGMMGLVFSNNQILNNYTNADGQGTTRPVIYTELDGLVATGNRVGARTEDIDAVSGANFFTEFIKFGHASARKVVVIGNEISKTTAQYSADTSILAVMGLIEGPVIRNNVGKANPPLRSIQTTNANATVIGQQALADGYTYRLSGRVVAVQSGGSNRAAYSFVGIYSASGGTATLASSSVTVEYESNAAWDLTLDANGANARIRATGAAATTITWGVYDIAVEIMG